MGFVPVFGYEFSSAQLSCGVVMVNVMPTARFYSESMQRVDPKTPALEEPRGTESSFREPSERPARCVAVKK